MRHYESLALHVDQQTTYSQLGPLAQFIVLNKHAGVDSELRSMHSYSADVLGSRITQAGLFGYVTQCLHDAPGGDIDAQGWAVCWPDAEALDLDKLNTEIRASKEGANGIDRMRLRFNAYQLLAIKLPDARKRLAEAEKRDESIAKLFAVAADARKAWRAQAASLQASIALQDQLDDAAIKNSRNPHLDGCAKAARDEFDAVVKATPLASFGDLGLKKSKDGRIEPPYDRAVAAIATTIPGYFAASAMRACASLTGQAPPLAHALRSSLVFRGERTAAMTALITSGIESDDRAKTFEFAMPESPSWGMPAAERDGGSGKLAKVTKTGDHVHLEFTAKMGTVTYCDEYRETGHVLAIESDGGLRYEMVCKAYKTDTVNRASKPFDVDLADGAGLKPGMYVGYEAGVLLAWNKLGDKAPALVFGIAVK
jgi:hypothetical protein